jgi:hypothetical protein
MSSAQEEGAASEGGQAAHPVRHISPKKETFQWSTPADEFAEDVESDDDDERALMNEEVRL